MKPATLQFTKEVRHFFRVSILNMVFAALAIAFGISYIVMAVLGQDSGIPFPGHRVLTGAVAVVSFGLGLGWLLSTTRVFGGIAAIRADLESLGGTAPDERVTCLIVRMLAHYRDNRETIRRMILVCMTGGCIFFVLGILDSLEVLTITGSGGEFSLDAVRLIPPMLVTLGIAVSSLLSSYYFRKFSVTWDRRLHEIDESECSLKRSLGLEES